jgi:hypothetical protein
MSARYPSSTSGDSGMSTGESVTPRQPTGPLGAFDEALPELRARDAASREAALKKKAAADLKERQEEWKAKEKMMKQLRSIRNPSEEERERLHEVERWLLLNNAPQFAGKTRRRKHRSRKHRKKHSRRR